VVDILKNKRIFGLYIVNGKLATILYPHSAVNSLFMNNGQNLSSDD
jgi:hypothetical protein